MGLEDDPFDWRVTKDGQLLVSRGGRVVTTISGATAAKLLARATGNYKHGNERHG
jgi:hypothetical protein